MATKRPLFRPYVALGLVSDSAGTKCAPVSHQMGLSYFLTTPVDGAHALHLYDLDLHMKHVSQALPSSWFPGVSRPQFSHLAAHQQLTLAAIANHIVVYNSFTPVTVWRSHSSDIIKMLVVADLLVTVDSSATLLVWQLPISPKDPPCENGTIVSKIILPKHFVTSSIVHPTAYVNKILLGAGDGRCILLNLRSSQVIHIFGPFPSAVTVLEPSPVADVVAVGTANGSIYLHNFRCDRTVLSFHHKLNSEGDPNVASNVSLSHSITALSFRTDGTETLASADVSGDLFIWDLNRKRICSEARNVHTSGVNFAEFVPGQPLLVTTGVSDNSIKVHVFDKDKDDVRLLRFREGHHLPPTMVRFCGEGGLNMVSAGMDRELRLVCAVREARNKPFSQSCADKRGKTAKKNMRKRLKIEVGDNRTELKHLLPPVSSMALSNARERDSEFANLVTVHSGRKEAYCWRLENGAFHQHVLRPPTEPSNYRLTFRRHIDESAVQPPTKKKNKVDKTPGMGYSDVALCASITPCGNFVVVGYANGTIHCFNLQSGLHQGVYSQNTEGRTKNIAQFNGDASIRDWGIAHSGPVNALCVDGCGDILASTGGMDHQIKFWGMHTRKPDGDCVGAAQSVTKMSWCEKSDLIVAAMENFNICAFDVPTRKIARIFKGHEGAIVDFCLTDLGRRIVSASMDGSIRIWDVPSGCCLNIMHCREAPTSISVSSNGDFLATTHSNCLSIRLWVNIEIFGHERTLSSIENDLMNEVLEDIDPENAEDMDTSDDYNDGQNVARVNISEETITLSGRPVSVWTVLGHLREVTERNKPKEPPKKGVNAPFFLPTVKGLSFKLDVDGGKHSETHGKGDEKVTSNGSTTEFEDDIESDNESENELIVKLSRVGCLFLEEKFSEAEQILGEGSAHVIERELAGLKGRKCRRNAVKYFDAVVKTGRNFELVQAQLGVFLKRHGEAISKDAEGQGLLEGLMKAQQERWGYLRDMFDSVQSLSSLFSGQA